MRNTKKRKFLVNARISLFHEMHCCQLIPAYTDETPPLLFSCSSYHGDSVCLQWLVGNVVGRDDTLYARMKQRDMDGHDTMWEPIFVDDAAIGLGDQKNKVQQKSSFKKVDIANVPNICLLTHVAIFLGVDLHKLIVEKSVC